MDRGGIISRRDWLKWTAFASASAMPVLQGCCRCPVCAVDAYANWQNHAGTIKAKPRLVSQPQSAKDLVLAVRAAEGGQYRVRMTGAGHSFSDVALSTGGHMLLPNQLGRALELDRSRLSDPNDPHLVRVQSGRTVRELNSQLDELGLAFANLGGYDGQTIVGAVSTGTHGSGLAYGPLTSQVVSWQIVTACGQMWQIEPKQGITRPTSAPMKLEEDPSIEVHLYQDDELFDAVAVNIGSLGIVYSVVLRVVPTFWLEETRTETTLEELSADGGFLADLVKNEGTKVSQHYEVYFNPYSEKNGKHVAILTHRKRLEQAPATLSKRRDPPAAAFDAEVAVALSKSQLASALLPAHRNQARDTISRALSHLVGTCTQVSHSVFHAGRINDARLFAVELAFPLRETIPMLSKTCSIAEQQAAKGLHYGPISLRFVASSSALIAPQQGTPTTMMEIGAPVIHPRSHALLYNYEVELCAKSNVRPHWGQDLGFFHDSTSVRAHWPDTWDRWLAAFARMNSTGVFDGDITDRLAISRTPAGGCAK